MLTTLISRFLLQKKAGPATVREIAFDPAVYHTAPLPYGTSAVPASSPVQIPGPGEFVLALFGNDGKTTAFMVVNRDSRKGSEARLKITLPGTRIQELDRKTGQWTEGEWLGLDRGVKVKLGPGDGRLFRIAVSDHPSSEVKNVID